MNSIPIRLFLCLAITLLSAGGLCAATPETDAAKPEAKPIGLYEYREQRKDVDWVVYYGKAGDAFAIEFQEQAKEKSEKRSRLVRIEFPKEELVPLRYALIRYFMDSTPNKVLEAGPAGIHKTVGKFGQTELILEGPEYLICQNVKITANYERQTGKKDLDWQETVKAYDQYVLGRDEVYMIYRGIQQIRKQQKAGNL